jgi:hypothetical protein
MGKTVQIRDLDEHTYGVLKGRATAAGLSLAQYLRGELGRLAEVPTMAEWLAETDRRREHGGGLSRDALQQAVDDIRRDRDER